MSCSSVSLPSVHLCPQVPAALSSAGDWSHVTHLGPETTNGPEIIRNVSSVLKFASGVVAIQHDTPSPTHTLHYASIVCFIIIREIKKNGHLSYYHVYVSVRVGYTTP